MNFVFQLLVLILLTITMVCCLKLVDQTKPQKIKSTINAVPKEGWGI